MWIQKVLLQWFQLHPEGELLRQPVREGKSAYQFMIISNTFKLWPMHISQSYQQQNRHEYADPAIGYNVLVQFLASTTPRNNEKHYYPMNGQKLKRDHLEVWKQFQMSICKEKYNLENVNILNAISRPISSNRLTFWGNK